MYKKSHNIDNIKYPNRYIIDGINLYYITEDKNTFYLNRCTNKELDWRIASNSSIDTLVSIQDFILVRFSNGQGQFFEKENEMSLQNNISKYNYVHLSDKNEDLIFCEFEREGKWYGGIFQVTTNQLIWYKEITELGFRQIKGNFLFKRGIANDEIIIEDIENGEVNWQFSVKSIGEFSDNGKSEPGIVNRILGVFGAVVIAVISGGGNKLRGSEQLIGLHIQTGELLWLLNDFEYEGVQHSAVPTIATLQADKNHQYLIGFQGGSFIKIDPETGKVLRYKKGITQYDSYTLTKPIDSFSLQGDYLYFRTVIASIGGWPTAIGAFNYQTEKIEWLHVFEEFKKQGCFLPIGQPKVEGSRVYALDSGGTLHIFEKEG